LLRVVDGNNAMHAGYGLQWIPLHEDSSIA
jgi:hypothetical protein